MFGIQPFKGGSTEPPFVRQAVTDVTKDYVLAVLRARPAARYS